VTGQRRTRIKIGERENPHVECTSADANPTFGSARR
jgi:hypothetical protein